MIPRQVAHRGSLLAAGFWVPPSPDAERNVLSLWQLGAEVYASTHGFIVVLRAPRRVNAALGAAAPLERVGRLLTSAPLSESELSTLPAACDVVLISGGELSSFTWPELERVEPAKWLDVGEFELLSVSAPPPISAPAPALSRPADASALFDEKTGRSAADKARQKELISALSEIGKGGTPSRKPGALQRFLRWLTQPRAGAASPSALARVPPAPSPWQRLLSVVGRWLANTRLGAYVGRKHAEYLNELFDLLGRHDDQEVLRRAIPLGGAGGGAPGGLPQLPPGPRTSFEISLGQATATSSIGLVTDLYERLRRSYEAVFERLDAAGRHEQAAYFLAEILGESERAVAYLERRGQLLLAARLAEARGLAPGLIVRQWFVAGDRERAVLVATREGAFDDAVTRLEKAGQRDEANSLRLLQAERLAQAGRFVAAAGLISGIERGRPLALRFLELARAAGDLRGVVLELSLDPERFETAQLALSSLTRASADEQPLLLHLASAFVRLQPKGAQPLARELGRELLAIVASGGDARVGQVAQQLARYVGGAFKADQPSLVSFESRGDSAARGYAYAAADGGASPVLDLCRHGAHTLLARGEAGAVLLNRHGKRVAHFDLPCESFVASPDGARVLCVARRGARLLVGRIDLATRRSEPWCELEASGFSRQFDGETWLVGRDNQLLLLDALGSSPRELRRAPQPLEAPVITVDGLHVNVVGSAAHGPLERLRYELPGLVLRQRSELVSFSKPGFSEEDDQPQLLACATAARGGPSTFAVYERWQEEAPTLRHGATSIALPDDAGVGDPSLEICGNSFALQLAEATRVRVLVGSQTRGVRLDLRLEGTSQASLRFDEGSLLIGDDAGRILGFDLERSATPLFDWRA